MLLKFLLVRQHSCECPNFSENFNLPTFLDILDENLPQEFSFNAGWIEKWNLIFFVHWNFTLNFLALRSCSEPNKSDYAFSQWFVNVFSRWTRDNVDSREVPMPIYLSILREWLILFMLYVLKSAYATYAVPWMLSRKLSCNFLVHFQTSIKRQNAWIVKKCIIVRNIYRCLENLFSVGW